MSIPPFFMGYGTESIGNSLSVSTIIIIILVNFVVW